MNSSLIKIYYLKICQKHLDDILMIIKKQRTYQIELYNKMEPFKNRLTRNGSFSAWASSLFHHYLK
jgi:hypothetical protein